MSNPRLFLTTMLNESAENLGYLHEMIDPILPYLDGLIVVVHSENHSWSAPCAAYLDSIKGMGKIIHRDWVKRHDVSMNETLYTECMQEGDIGIWCDLNELPMPEFVSKIKTEILPVMEAQQIDVLAYYGKAYVYRYSENLRYRESPHWVLTGFRRGAEYSQIEPDESKVRKNMQPIRRTDPQHYVRHFAYYYLYPAGSNQCALGLDRYNSDPKEQEKFFIERETRRLDFRRALKKRGIPLTVDAVIGMMKSGNMDEEMKEFVRREKVLNDVYRKFILNDLDFRDAHDWKDLVEVK